MNSQAISGSLPSVNGEILRCNLLMVFRLSPEGFSPPFAYGNGAIAGLDDLGYHFFPRQSHLVRLQNL